MKTKHHIDLSKLIDLTKLNTLNHNTLMEVIGIEYTDLGINTLKGKMKVCSKVHQPAGQLHGGASIALAESLGSMGTAVIADYRKNIISCIEISANHVRAIFDGYVFGCAELIHCGRTTHVWIVNITDENENLISSARLTMMIIPKKEI